MSRWIVFDRATAEAVESKTGSQVELRNPTEPLAGIAAAAAATSGAAVALAPAAEAGQTLVLRFTRIAKQTTQAAAPVPAAHTAPGGFLGLADEVVLEDEPAAPKKWWQKILD